jgi:hypothetical protein
VSAQNIHCSDISLFSSVLGYFFDPTKQVGALGFLPEGQDTRDLLDGLPSETEIDRAAGILLAIKYTQIIPTAEYLRWQRLQYFADREKIHARYVTMLKASEAVLGGITYEIRDAHEHIELVGDDARTFIWYVPPFYTRGYEKMYDSRGEYSWQAPEIPELTLKEASKYLGAFGLRPACMAVFCMAHFDLSILNSPEWHHLFVEDTGNPDRQYCVLMNRDAGISHMQRHKRISPQPQKQHLAVYDNHEITPHSKVGFVVTNKERAMYYYDLFVKRLGITAAENHYLFVIDGQIAGVCGFNLRHFRLRRFRTLHEVFGLICASTRYSRLNRLRLRLMTGQKFLDQVYSECVLDRALPSFTHVQTTCLSRFPEVMSHRGIFKRVLREKHAAGGYRIVYEGKTHPMTHKAVLREWLRKNSND